jgi:hypothetical protein
MTLNWFPAQKRRDMTAFKFAATGLFVLCLAFDWALGLERTDRSRWDWSNRLRANNIFEKPLTKAFIVRSVTSVLRFLRIPNYRPSKCQLQICRHQNYRHWLTRVARWNIFKPKIPIWVNFGGSCNGRCLKMLRPNGLFYGHLVYFVAIWYILWLFDIFFPVLVCRTRKNLATPWLTQPKVTWLKLTFIVLDLP